ncbi:MAG: GNAT family acetyltransferase [Thaumarchaeota archaeon]|nr:GNAT family acetyltransferase [Nitrososphaerota archaeon]
MKVREFRLRDYVEVSDLWEKSSFGTSRGDGLGEIRRKLKRDPELFLVAEEDGRVVGSVLGAWDGRRGWLYHLGVLPEYKRKGVATRLVQEVERRMRRKGVLKVNAVVYNRNRASFAFFKRLGYQADKSMTFHGKVLRED